MKGNGEITAEEAQAYLDSRGSRRNRRDWAGIMRRIMKGESQVKIAEELGTSGSQISNGLKRYAQKIVEASEKKS